MSDLIEIPVDENPNDYDKHIQSIIITFIQNYTGDELFRELKKGMPMMITINAMEVLLFECVVYVGKTTSGEHDIQRKSNTKRETDINLN